MRTRSAARIRDVCAVLMFFGLCCTFLINAQTRAYGSPTAKPDEQHLILKTIGNGRMLGRVAAFRIYSAADETEASVWYGALKSNEEAKRVSKEWLKGYKITSKNEARDQSGRVIGKRIVAQRKGSKSENEFLVIRRYGLDYWLIRSAPSQCRWTSSSRRPS